MHHYHTKTRDNFRTAKTPIAEKFLVARLRLSAPKVLFWKAAKTLGGGFRTDVTLGSGK